MASDNAILEVGSHAPLVILIFIVGYYRDAAYISIICRTLMNSILYHLCLSEAYCITPAFEYLHVQDHYGVWSLVFWGMLSPMMYRPEIFVPTFFAIESLLSEFAWLLPVSIIFPLTLSCVYFSFTIIRFMVGIPLQKLCPILLTIGVAFILGGAWFQYSVPSIHDPDYPWKHPIWHALVMTGAIFIYLASKTTVWRTFHLDGYYVQGMSMWKAHVNRNRKSRH